MRLQDLKILQPGEDILWQDLDLVPGTQSIEAGYVSLHQDIKRFLHLGYKSGKPEIFGAFSRHLVPLHEKSFKGGCWGWCRAIGKRKQNSTCLAGGRPRGAGWRRASPAAGRSGWFWGRSVGEGGTKVIKIIEICQHHHYLNNYCVHPHTLDYHQEQTWASWEFPPGSTQFGFSPKSWGFRRSKSASN